MNRKPLSQSSDADLRNSHAALLRAALRARELARSTGTRVIVSMGGIIRYMRPDAPGVAEPGADYGEDKQ